ncbi:uncharacterized protein LOC142905683 [Petromyzon marinus]|uniref:uncharacterized protein LOC142905683 n=1 Tax=Petromyzon marinus TaxID=7757 RepID=UPI003F71188F
MSESEFEVGDELLDLLLERPCPAVGPMGGPLGGPRAAQMGAPCAPRSSAFFPGPLGGLLTQQGKASESEPWGLEDVLALTEDAQDDLLQSFVMDDAALQMLRAPGTPFRSPSSLCSSTPFPSPASLSSPPSPVPLASPSASDSGVSEGGGPTSPYAGVRGAASHAGPCAARPWASFPPEAPSPGGSSSGGGSGGGSGGSRSLSSSDDVAIDFDGWDEPGMVAAPSVVRALPALTAALRSSRQLLHRLTGAGHSEHDVVHQRGGGGGGAGGRPTHRCDVPDFVGATG